MDVIVDYVCVVDAIVKDQVAVCARMIARRAILDIAAYRCSRLRNSTPTIFVCVIDSYKSVTGRHIDSSTNEFEHMNREKYFLHRILNLASPTSLQCQRIIALAHNTSIMTSAVARLRAVPFALSLNRSLLLVTAIIIILIHLHLTSRGLQVGLLRLRLRRSLRLHRRRGLGRGLRLRRLLLSWGCRCRLFPALFCCGYTRGWLGVNLRWSEGWWMVSHFGRVVVLISTSLVICASDL
jgi:hypothetical protein